MTFFSFSDAFMHTHCLKAGCLPFRAGSVGWESRFATLTKGPSYDWTTISLMDRPMLYSIYPEMKAPSTCCLLDFANDLGPLSRQCSAGSTHCALRSSATLVLRSR